MPTPLQYIKTLDEGRKEEVRQLHDLICKTVPKLKPFLLESAHGTIIGYGKAPYETKSGCKGEWFTVGLANRKAGIALYICSAKNGKYLAELYAKKLPKTKIGKSCITMKALADVDLSVITKLIKEAGDIGMTFG